MRKTCNIIVDNRSGQVQNYSIASEPPQVSGSSDPDEIWSNVFQTASRVPDGAQASFTIYGQHLFAIAGQWHGGSGAGSRVGVSQTKPVTLGKVNDDGSITPGTSLHMTVIDDTTPSLDNDALAPGGRANSFEIKTGSFDEQTAKDNNFFIGLALSADGATATPVASFQPKPNTSYQIQSPSTFYLVSGRTMETGTIIVTTSTPGERIDFTQHGATVRVTHTREGTLKVSSA